MQNPTAKTPIPRCIHLGRYSAKLLGKFPQNKGLADCATQMTDITTALEKANTVYEQSTLTIVEARAELRFVDFTSDAELRQVIRRAELADGKKGGPLVAAIAPDGQTPLVKPFGQAQLDVLVDLVGTLKALVPQWPGATQEVAVVDGLRSTYADAVQGRADAWQNARDLRKTRNLARQAFVTGYTQISNTVKALFPDDKKMQEIFFDEVSHDVEKDLGDDAPTDPANPNDGGPGTG